MDFPHIDASPVSTRVWTRVVLTVLIVLCLCAVAVGFYLVVQDIHHQTCRAINKNTQFIKDTDAYILRNTTHPEDPGIASIHKFLVSESAGKC